MYESELNSLKIYVDSLPSREFKQLKGDIDYFVSWFTSNNLTLDNTRIPPHPAGINTVDKYSNNCPIPYIKASYNVDNKHKSIIVNLLNTLTHLKSLVPSDLQACTAIDSYTGFISTIISSPVIPDDPSDDKTNIIYGYISTNGDKQVYGNKYSTINKTTSRNSNKVLFNTHISDISYFTSNTSRNSNKVLFNTHISDISYFTSNTSRNSTKTSFDVNVKEFNYINNN